MRDRPRRMLARRVGLGPQGQAPHPGVALGTAMALLWLGACKGKSPQPRSSSPDSATSSPDSPTWYGDILPIMEARCASCHYTGSSAPFPLSTHDEVALVSGYVADAVSSGRMPPWPPGPDCQDYQADRSLSAAQIEAVVAWDAAGAPLGDPATRGDPLEPLPGLSRVDLTLGMAESYTPALEPDDYRCFLVEWPYDTDVYITGFSTRPSAPAIVHHATAFKVPIKLASAYRELEAADPGYGYPCYGGPGAGTVWIAGWAPGTLGTDFPEGTGVRMEPDALLGFQIHYNTAFADPAPDQTEIDLRIESEVEVPARTLRLWDDAWLEEGGLEIPAGEPSVVWSTSHTVGGEGQISIYSGNLHMHTLGVSGRLEVEHSDGSRTCLLDIPAWDFHWQGDYFLQEAVAVESGETLHMSCEFDNSEGTENVYWGEGTHDEMCTGKLYVVDQ